jgi:alpha-beta hydrolase superfamily lysophospholipase
MPDRALRHAFSGVRCTDSVRVAPEIAAPRVGVWSALCGRGAVVNATVDDVRFVRVRTRDGVLLHGLHNLVPAGHDAVLAVHGAWGNFYNTPWFDVLGAAEKRGYRALSLNSRGHDVGTLGDGEPSIGFARDLFEQAPADLDAGLSLLSSAGPESSVLVAAHSYGCHKVSYWMATARPPEVRGLVLASPGPPLRESAKWFVDGDVGDYLREAQQAVDAGEPNRLLLLARAKAPVPMVAEAATVLSTWGPASRADTVRYAPQLSLPVLVTVGRREPSPYRAKADAVAAALPDAELIELDDDHYYAADRAALVEQALDWAERRGVLQPKKEDDG